MTATFEVINDDEPSIDNDRGHDLVTKEDGDLSWQECADCGMMVVSEASIDRDCPSN